MSKALVDGLISGVLQGAAFQADKSIKGTYGDIFREQTEKAAHLLVLNKQELKVEIADIIYRAYGYDYTKGGFNYEEQVETIVDPTVDVFSDKELIQLTDIIYNNIYNAATTLNKSELQVEVHPTSTGCEILLKGPYNIFDTISRQIFSKAFGTGINRGGIHDFLIKHAQKNKELQRRIASSGPTNAGLDIGHGASSDDDLSNVENALQVLILNRIRTNKLTKDLTLDEKVDKELAKFDEELRRVANNPTALRQLWGGLVRSGKISVGTQKGRKYGVSEQELQNFLLTFLDFGVTFIRDVHAKGEASVQLESEVKITNVAQLKEVAEELEIAVRPQSSKFNSIMGAGVQAQFGKLTSANYTAIINTLSDWVKGKKKIAGLPDNVMEMEGSPSAKELMAAQLYNLLKFGKTTDLKQTTSTYQKATPATVKAKKPKPNVAKAVKGLLGPTQTPPKVNRIRNSKGQFTSLVNVVNLINMQLADRIRQNMGSPRLNYRTGRFAQSAKVLTADIDKDGVLRLPYTYMKYPYQTFEPGYAMGSVARDPKALITKSIRELAQNIVSTKLRIVRT